MIEDLIAKLRNETAIWDEIQHLFQTTEFPSKTTLLCEGETSTRLYFVKKGCLRMWFNNDGKDVTFQFFFEGQAVSSMESFFGKQPSIFNLETIEPSQVTFITKEGFDELFGRIPALKEGFQQILIGRLSDYSKLFLSRIKDNPQKRYEELLQQHPEIIRRIPQHYIASYLGITPISLSRIRNRK
jgi:CRP-like cAMP-binding protein